MVATKQNDASISELTEALNSLEEPGEEKGNLVLKKTDEFSSDIDNNFEPDLGLFDNEEDDENEEDEEDEDEKGRKFSSRAIVRFGFIFGLVSLGVIGFVNVMLREKNNNTANMNYDKQNQDAVQLLAEQKKRSNAEIERLNERIAELENQSLLDKQTELIKSQTIELDRSPQVSPPPTVVRPVSPPPSPPPSLPPSPPPVIRVPPPPQQIDPSAISSKAAQTGHYTVGGSWDKPVNIIADTNNNRPNAPKETVQILDNKDKLLTWGTKATGELETQIGWEGSLSSIASKNFAIRLTSHLLSPNGKVVVPSGTKIIARIASAKATGEIQLVAKYFHLEPTNGDRVIIVTIPDNTIKLQDRDRDGLLIAKPRLKKTLGRDAIAAILGGTAKMTEIINRPESSSHNSWNGGSNSTVINGDGNVGAAFIGGAAEQLNSRMTRQNEAEIRRRMNEPIVFVLPKNTEIEIYINENFYPLQGSPPQK